MEEDEAPPASPSLPKRGTYSLDFDSLDENTNPFATKSKIGFGSSPPINSSVSAINDEEFNNLFKPGKALANSPPGSPKLPSANNKTTDFGDAEDMNDTFNHSDTPTHDKGNYSNNALEDSINEEKPRSQAIPKKKKMIKKPKAQSKFKPPKNFTKQDDSGDIEILMPGMDTDNNNKVIEPPKEFEDSSTGNLPDFPASSTGEDGDPPLDAAPEAMATSLEVDLRFIEGEEGDDELINEGFAASHEKCKDPSELAMPKDGAIVDKKGGASGQHQIDQILMTKDISDILDKEDDSDEKRVRSSHNYGEHRRKSTDNAILSQTSAPVSESGEGNRTRHPAVRALEAAQTENLPIQSKSESSSEEGQFYDAFDFAPPPPPQASVGGQAMANIVDKAPNEGQGEQNKGTVVQLVQEAGNGQVLRYSQSDWNKMKQELELNHQTSLLNKERDFSLLLADRDKKIASLTDTSKKLKATNEDMRMVVAEFEKTISQLQADKEKSRSESHKTVYDLEQERDQALEDLQSVETAFSDLHRRYEKSKSIIEGFKRNEEQLKNCVEDLQGKIKKSESKLLSLRSQAEEKLDRANEDIEKIKKSTRSEVVRLEAALKKAELRISSLEESLQRKEKENHELTAICDELIAKVGS